MGLELYSKIEQYLDFEEEVIFLHKEFLRILAKYNPKSVIDIGCGQGAFLEQLKYNDVEAFGIDLSSEQIKVCTQKGLNAKEIALNSVDEKYDCATAIFDVVNYIPQNELEEFFKSANNVINKDGYFIFDVNTHFGFDEVAQGSLSMDLDDKFLAIDAIFENNQLKTDITLFSLTKDNLYLKEQDYITQYFHTTKELEKLLKSANFEIEEIKKINLHNYEKEDKLIFICKK